MRSTQNLGDALLERVTNVCLVLTCVLVSALVVQRFRSPDVQAPPGIQQYAVGESVPALDGVRFGDKSKTVVLMLASTCGFCTESMPFYAELAAKRASGNFQIVVGGFEPVAKLGAYLAAHGAQADHIVTVKPGTIKAAGTPTLIVVDANRRVLGTWHGALRGREDSVEQLLGKS
jgi:thiol-disulfide isomerase/thioredoxin